MYNKIVIGGRGGIECAIKIKERYMNIGKANLCVTNLINDLIYFPCTDPFRIFIISEEVSLSCLLYENLTVL